jgi:hypothetical protein
MPVGVEGVLAFRVRAQAVLQLAVNVAIVGVVGGPAWVCDALRVRVQPLNDLIVCVALLEAEAFFHFHLNASLIRSRI